MLHYNGKSEKQINSLGTDNLMQLFVLYLDFYFSDTVQYKCTISDRLLSEFSGTRCVVFCCNLHPSGAASAEHSPGCSRPEKARADDH